MKYMFEDCYLLKEIFFLNLTKNKVSINEMFVGCSDELNINI